MNATRKIQHKARRRNRQTTREMSSHINAPFRDRSACPTLGKVAYATKHHAKAAIRRARRVFMETSREHALANPKSVGSGKPRAYRCRCGHWHLGHLPHQVRSGPAHRSDVFEDAE